jgi:hypothetical protein
MFLGICAVSKASAGPGTPDKRATKRRRSSDAAVSGPHVPAEATAEEAAAEALRVLSLPVCHKKRLCFLFADSPDNPAIVGAMLVHQFGGGMPFKVVCEFADVPVPLHKRQTVPISQRAAAYLRTMPTSLMFLDFAAPDTPPELSDIFEALRKSGNLSIQKTV